MRIWIPCDDLLDVLYQVATTFVVGIGFLASFNFAFDAVTQGYSWIVIISGGSLGIAGMIITGFIWFGVIIWIIRRREPR